MYVKSTRPSAKREVQKERSAKRDDQIARPWRAETCERSELRAMRMCPRGGQIFFYKNIHHYDNNAFPRDWCTMGPESKDNVYTVQFGERLCRSSSSAVRKWCISCPEQRYKIYHGVWCCCCCLYRCNRFTEIFSV